MHVEDGKLVTLDYTITTDTGEHIESSSGRGGPLKFIFGTQSGLLPGLTDQLKGMGVDEEKEFTLPPEKAFGTADSGPTMTIPKSAFPQDAIFRIGHRFQGEVPGTNQTVNFEILENRPNEAYVRLIHPLAGKTINIKVKILALEEGPKK